MIPTRQQIYEKIQTLVDDPTKNKEDYFNEIVLWLDEMECPQKDKEAILDDLTSYPNY